MPIDVLAGLQLGALLRGLDISLDSIHPGLQVGEEVPGLEVPGIETNDPREARALVGIGERSNSSNGCEGG